jgi:hypothetical protein
MPVRNKKKSIANRQKMEKAQHLKQFVTEVRELIAKAAGSDIARYIPQEEIEQLYTIRFRPVRVNAAPGETIPADILQFVNHLVILLFKDYKVPIGVGTLEQVSLYDFYSIVHTVMIYGSRLSDDDYSHAAEVKNALAPLIAIYGSPINTKAFNRYNNVMNTAALFCCDIEDYMYAIKYNPAIVAKGKPGLFSEIYRTRLPKVKVQIDEQPRPAWQLAWYVPEPELGLKFINMPSEALYLPPGKMLDVYIQSHALNRLAERLKGIDISVLYYSVLNSFNQPKVCRNRRGVLLLEYSVLDDKVGYFVCEVAEEKVILKTFLFLTHNGTPEAEKLQATMGLMKEDISYLDIDKLSTFVLSDIADNDRLKQLFIDAGCECLFQFDKGMYKPFEDKSPISKAEAIARYLQLDGV